jgi:hypothetical protein
LIEEKDCESIDQKWGGAFFLKPVFALEQYKENTQLSISWFIRAKKNNTNKLSYIEKVTRFYK